MALQRAIGLQQKQTVAFLREMVECESPSDNPAAVDRFVDLFAAHVADIAKVRTVKAAGYGKIRRPRNRSRR